MSPTFALSYSTPFAGVDPDRMMTVVRLAESCGFEAVYFPEHMALYHGAKVGAMEMPPTLEIPDPLDCLAFVAAGTERILLGTGVLLLPHHHPVVLAKRLATIDVLSKGRMRLFTIGVGALPGEAEAVGIDFATRGRQADEAIEVLRLLWSGGADGVSFHGEFYDLERVCSYPKPVGVTELPIHVGGSSRAAARRAGRLGHGYFPGGALSDEERATQWELAKTAAVEAGRDPETLEHTRWGSLGLTEEHVERLAKQGVTRIVVGVPDGDLEEQCAGLSAFAERFGLRAG